MLSSAINVDFWFGISYCQIRPKWAWTYPKQSESDHNSLFQFHRQLPQSNNFMFCDIFMCSINFYVFFFMYVIFWLKKKIISIIISMIINFFDFNNQVMVFVTKFCKFKVYLIMFPYFFVTPMFGECLIDFESK